MSPTPPDLQLPAPGAARHLRQAAAPPHPGPPGQEPNPPGQPWEQTPEDNPHVRGGDKTTIEPRGSVARSGLKTFLSPVQAAD